MEKFVNEDQEKPIVTYEVIGNNVRLCKTSIDKLPYEQSEYLSNVINGIFILNR